MSLGGVLRLRLPATSANLGPGFDSLALALALFLEIDAQLAEVGEETSIRATGRNVDVCSRIEGNLLLAVYSETVRRYAGREAPALAVVMRNGIPLGMGCGSSGATRLAGVAMASHFGGLGWSREQILAEAAWLEGHPDNVAACWLGGFVASGRGEPAVAWGAAQGEARGGQGGVPETARRVAAVSITPPPGWRALVVLPELPLATSVSRAVLPEQYNRMDAVENVQRVAVLTAAFAAGRGDLLRAATGDRLHQPYRGASCPLLPALLSVAGREGILSVTLSGAGPAVLLLLEGMEAVGGASRLVREQVPTDRGGASIAEVLVCALAMGAGAVEAE